MAEYRLDDLARVSGVSARNIRAYRERGLLDPPRRVGRSAYYDDFHLSQLKTINQLLRKGFNSAHIAEFFTSMREGADLADILGIQRAVLGPRSEEVIDTAGATPSTGGAGVPGRQALDIDPDCDEAQKLVDYGLADRVDGTVVLLDRAMGDIVARTPDQLLYVRAILRIFESTRQAIDTLAREFVQAMEELYTSRFGVNHLPKSEEMAELSRIVEDYRDLGNKVVADRLVEATQRQMVTAVSDYTAGILLSGRWEPTADEPRNPE